jgi:hypothetical protein
MLRAEGFPRTKPIRVRGAVSPNEANTSSDVLSSDRERCSGRVGFPRTKPIRVGARATSSRSDRRERGAASQGFEEVLVLPGLGCECEAIEDEGPPAFTQGAAGRGVGEGLDDPEGERPSVAWSAR